MGGSGADAFHRPLRVVLKQADHVLYQSEFCKRAADEWVTQPGGSWEVPHNAVDVGHFTPADEPPQGGPVLLLGGSVPGVCSSSGSRRWRTALCHPEAQLLVTGRLVTPIEPLIERFGVEGHVHVLGR